MTAEHFVHQAESPQRHSPIFTSTRRATPTAGDSSDVGQATLEPAGFRHVLGHFCTGVAVVTALQEGHPIGLTIQSFSSVSLSPPLVSICLATSSSTWSRMKSSGGFCVNVLGDEQEWVSRAFAAKSRDRFEGVIWRCAPMTGSPLLNGVLAWVDCWFEDEHHAGDHVIALGRVVALGALPHGSPLLFYRGGYGQLGIVDAGRKISERS